MALEVRLVSRLMRGEVEGCGALYYFGLLQIPRGYDLLSPARWVTADFDQITIWSFGQPSSMSIVARHTSCYGANGPSGTVVPVEGF